MVKRACNARRTRHVSFGTMLPDTPSLPYLATTWILPILLGITLHEAAHAYVADLCGDDTPRRRGRLTLNPLAHIDPFGTILLPGMLLLMNAPFLFGYARPVPVNPHVLRRPTRDMMLIAAAGPASNLLQAIVALRLLQLFAEVGETSWLTDTLARAAALNVGLTVFNLLPIPPLDGAHIAIGLLPRRLSRSLAALMPHGMALMIGLVVVLPSIGRALGVNIDIVGQAVSRLVRLTLDGLVWLGA